ncbi:MAG TPA: TIGR03557 family F420-dependent LLM class oxidoreductase, partial [Longimicrobiales bacterium]|nr:TIGR03557 family F420-dependent LLM class oxidoreductase [Longimicrobiales bacterium]
WSWLGAALQATSMAFGVVNAPGDRYHPAIIAQAAATLAEMFPDRFWLAVGSGEALNEHVTGQPWPLKPERNERLRECAAVMRALWRGETVTHHGRVVVEEARVYSLPVRPPRLYCAAVSEETAGWAGGWADGLVTTGRPRAAMAQMIDAFVRGGGAGKPIIVQHTLSWARSQAEAQRAAFDQWRISALTGHLLWDLRTPREFDEAARGITMNDVARKISITASLAEHTRQLHAYSELGIDQVYIFNVGKNQREFIDVFGTDVLPHLRS